MTAKAAMPVRFMNLVEPLGASSTSTPGVLTANPTARRTTDTTARHTSATRSGAVSPLIGASLRQGDVDSSTLRSIRATTPGARTSSTATATRTTRTTSSVPVLSADSYPITGEQPHLGLAHKSVEYLFLRSHSPQPTASTSRPIIRRIRSESRWQRTNSSNCISQLPGHIHKRGDGRRRNVFCQKRQDDLLNVLEPVNTTARVSTPIIRTSHLGLYRFERITCMGCDQGTCPNKHQMVSLRLLTSAPLLTIPLHFVLQICMPKLTAYQPTSVHDGSNGSYRLNPTRQCSGVFWNNYREPRISHGKRKATDSSSHKHNNPKTGI